MANEEHLAILKQGVEAWNKWREENRKIPPELRKSSLSFATLRGADFIGSHLGNADLTYADLTEARLIFANLSGANLRGADLRGAHLEGAVLRGVDLKKADLSRVSLSGVDLSGADLCVVDLRFLDLSGANLSSADLRGAELGHANLSSTNLQNADFTKAVIEWTIFAGTDLSTVKGLHSVHHLGPSYISIDTLYKSAGNIPESFLRGCGVPDEFITYAHSLIDKAFEFYSCFISYSNKNRDFAERVYNDLQSRGVRCWFAPENLKIGEKIRVGIDDSIRLHDKLLLVLSKHSVESEWVEKEVETALEQERKQKRTVLFPVMLDNSVMKIESGWPADIRRSRNMGDFRKWRDHDAYQKAFARLLCDLKMESKS